METIPLLKKLAETPGLSGFEGPERDSLRQTWEGLVDSLHQDRLGSLIAFKAGAGEEPRPRLMLAAHMDEIGLMVTGVERGFLRVTRVGGTDRRSLLGCEVVVHGKRDLPGFIATRPPHVLPPEERKKAVPWERIFVDVGLPAGEVEELVKVGDLISFSRQLAELENRRVAGKALDNRACLVIVTLALGHLAGMRHVWDVYAVATVQEEIGLKGAIAAAYGVEPDVAVALDVAWARQPGVPDEETFPLGEGPLVTIGPNFHPGLVARLKKVADEHEIPYHVEPAPGGSGTDAWAIQVSRQGVPSALIGLPLRYMHQPVEMVAVQDIERAARLLAAFVAGLEADFTQELVLDPRSPGGES